MVEREKYVDESWKESAQLEKELLAQKLGGAKSASKADSSAANSSETSSQQQANETDENFMQYISSLGYQAMIFLGEIPHPATQLIEKNLDQARFIIDSLAMLRRKTKGNLSKEENQILEASLYELQMKYVQLAKQETAQGLG